MICTGGWQRNTWASHTNVTTRGLFKQVTSLKDTHTPLTRGKWMLCWVYTFRERAHGRKKKGFRKAKGERNHRSEIKRIKTKSYQFSYYCKTFQVQSIKHAILTSDTYRYRLGSTNGGDTWNFFGKQAHFTQFLLSILLCGLSSSHELR